ncbi:MAG: glycosyltransferase [Bacteroidia bacterium]|nr:glycosyltransferase [Bacteroidia bacterium]
MNNLKLSIITINRNNAEGLRKTIESVVNQNFTDFEYIVIDGASTDGSVEVIKEYADRITNWVSEPDKGIYNAMNKGILKAKGEYLLFLNSGDCLFNKQVLFEVFDKPFNEDFVYGDEIIEINSRQIKSTYPNKLDFGYLRRGGLPHQSTFIRREMFDNELYNENYKVISDWEFVVENIIFRNKTYLKKNITVTVFDGNGVSASADLKSREKRLVLSKKFNDNILKDFNNSDILYAKSQTQEYLLLDTLNENITNLKIIRRLLKVLLLLNRMKLIR